MRLFGTIHLLLDKALELAVKKQVSAEKAFQCLMEGGASNVA